MSRHRRLFPARRRFRARRLFRSGSVEPPPRRPAAPARPLAVVVALAALTLVGTTCTAEREDDPGAQGVTTTAVPGRPATVPAAPTETPPPAPPVPAPALDGLSVELVEMAAVEAPTSMAVRPGDPALYVTEQGGRLRRLVPDRDAYDLVRTPMVDLSDEVTAGGEQGLLGVAFSIDGRRLYLSFTGTDGRQYVDEWTVTDSGSSVRADGDSRRNVITVDDFAPNHNGGQLALGPDGFLWYSMGDGGGAGDPRDTGQDPSDLLGSLLRIDPDGGDPYAVPASNPFVQGGGAPEVFAYGLRNPWRFSFDSATGDLWIADVGQGDVEEIDFLAGAGGLPAGANFGWSELEGDEPFDGGEAPAGAVAPLHTYALGDGRCAVVGGYVYRGAMVPALVGAYLYGDYCDGGVRALAQSGGELVAEASLGVTVPNLSSFGQDQNGEIYALSLDGPIYRIQPAG